MLHIREAYDDAYFEILKELPGILREMFIFLREIQRLLKKFLDLDFTLSFTGVITFTHDYDEVIKYIPPNSIMSETDAPFVAPVPYRGKRNEPAYVVEIVKKMAEIRGENEDILSEAIINNAKRVFGI